MKRMKKPHTFLFFPFSLKPAMLKFYPRNLLNPQNNRTPLPETNRCLPLKIKFQPFPFGEFAICCLFSRAFWCNFKDVTTPPRFQGVSPPPCVELGSCHTPASPRCSGWVVKGGVFFLAKPNDDTYSCR